MSIKTSVKKGWTSATTKMISSNHKRAAKQAIRHWRKINRKRFASHYSATEGCEGYVVRQLWQEGPHGSRPAGSRARKTRANALALLVAKLGISPETAVTIQTRWRCLRVASPASPCSSVCVEAVDVECFRRVGRPQTRGAHILDFISLAAAFVVATKSDSNRFRPLQVSDFATNAHTQNHFGRRSWRMKISEMLSVMLVRFMRKSK